VLNGNINDTKPTLTLKERTAENNNGTSPAETPVIDHTITTATAEIVTVADYADAVRQGKAVVADLDGAWWRLCEIADAVTTRWGEQDLEKFFEDVGVGCVGPRRLSVYRKYKDHFSAPGPKCLYSVLRALQTHPNRAELIRKFPDMSKAQADAHMKEFEESKKTSEESKKTSEESKKTSEEDADQDNEQQDEDEGDGDEDPDEGDEDQGDEDQSDDGARWRKDNRGWLRELLLVANKADAHAKAANALAKEIGDLGGITEAVEPLSPEQRAMIRQTMLGMEKLLPTLEQGAAALIAAGTTELTAGAKLRKIISYLQQLEDDDAEEPITNDSANPDDLVVPGIERDAGDANPAAA
jgi:hypothetical protein